ncbi:MFS transporter [Nocardioides plantarum]|nr:MFS transporter [Nocardioides plantarum]
MAGTCLIAGTYGLVRLGYGLFLPDIRASIGLGSAAAGYVAAGSSVAYCLGALLGLGVGGRARALVVGALATASCGAAGMALSTDVAMFVPLAVLSSVGAGLASPGMVAVIERNVRRAERDRAQAVVNAGTGPGLVAAGALALVLLPRWQLGFAVAAIVTAAAGIAVLALDRPRPAYDGPARTDGEDQPTDQDDRVDQDDEGHAWMWDLRRPAAAALLLGAGSASVWTYGRSLLVAQGAGADASVVAWMAVGVGGSATVVTAGRLARLPPPRAWLLSCGAVGVSIAVLAAGASYPALALVACAAFGWSFVAATTALIAWAGSRVPDRAAPGTSMLFVMLTLGQAAGSAAGGAIGDARGLPFAFALAAGVTAAAAAVATGRVRRPGPATAGRPGRSRPGGAGRR